MPVPSSSSAIAAMRADLPTRVARVARLSPRLLLLAGAPGAGKGAAAATLSAAGWRAASAGGLLRDAARTDAAVADTLAAGGVVPGAVSAAAVLAWMEAEVGGGEGSAPRWVVDGFPRSIEGARVWEEAGGFVWGFLEIAISRGELERRLSLRGREDDAPEVVQRRMALHAVEMPMLREFYKRMGVYGYVDGEGSVEQVAGRMRDWIEDRAA